MGALCTFSVLIIYVLYIHKAKACPLPLDHATARGIYTGRIELSRFVLPASYHTPSIQHILKPDVAKRRNKSRRMNVIVHHTYLKNGFPNSAFPRSPVDFSILRIPVFGSLSVQKRRQGRKLRTLSSKTVAVPTTTTAVAVAIATAGTPTHPQK